MTDDYRRAIIDHSRSACLCDAGLPDVDASVCIAPDGHVDLVLIDTKLLGDDCSTYDPTTAEAPHEQTGPLPGCWRDRVQLAPLRCGHRTQRGTPCRNFVTCPGQPCGWHRPTNQRKEQS
jgi:hypothetical protein